jgi:hypothetical protein
MNTIQTFLRQQFVVCFNSNLNKEQLNSSYTNGFKDTEGRYCPDVTIRLMTLTKK